MDDCRCLSSFVVVVATDVEIQVGVDVRVGVDIEVGGTVENVMKGVEIVVVAAVVAVVVDRIVD